MIAKNLIHYIKVKLGIDVAETQTTDLEKKALIKYVNGKKVVIEIGVFEGANTVMLAKHMGQEGKLYGIDPFFRGKLGISYSYLIVQHFIRKNALKSRVELIRKFSIDACQDVPDKIDFIFIDGDHSWEGIQNDWILYAPKIVQNGIIALHDTAAPEFQQWKIGTESVKFFEQVIQKDNRFELVETIDSLNVLRKK